MKYLFITILLIQFECLASTLIVTSDTHVSNKDGRLYGNNQRFVEFIESQPDNYSYMFVGDMIDNVVDSPREVGDVIYRNDEFDLFDTIMGEREYFITYGIGHDFGNGETKLSGSVEHTGRPSRGIHQWGKYTLVWITPVVGAFPSLDGFDRPAFNEDDLDWLDLTLSYNGKFLLFFHIPLRAEGWGEAYYGTPDGREYAIPLEDRIYEVIENNKSKLSAIVSGHVHRSFFSQVSGVPYYMFPFASTGCHGKFTQSISKLSIEAVNCKISHMDFYPHKGISNLVIILNYYLDD